MNSLVERMSSDLKLQTSYIESIIRRSNFYYKKYNIPKKNGGNREILQASPELKTLQYWVKTNILSSMPVSDRAFAYNKGNSIKHHADYHKNAYFIFHSDIKEFFPSITSKHLIETLKTNRQKIGSAGFWYDDLCDTISAICFRYDELCIGTVSSPAICNIIMYAFDEYFREYCDSRNWRYSRYADDIYISSQEYIPTSIRDELEKKLGEYGFVVNDKKTWFCSKKGRRQITGLILTESGRVSIGSKKREAIKKMVYNRIVHGQGDPNVILGHLAFLKDVEPKVYNSFLIKYAGYCDGDVIDAIMHGPKPKTIVFEVPEIFE